MTVCKNIYLTLLAGLLWGACANLEAPQPTYVEIAPFEVNAPGGAKRHKITEGWLYVNNELLGGYTLPARVPVLASGNQSALVFPGVKVNGISNTPGIYPFLERYETTLNFSGDNIIPIQPATRYVTNANAPWAERGTFDLGSGIGLNNRDSDPGNSFIISSENAFEGKHLLLRVTEDHPLMEVATEFLTLPTDGGRQIWLELHYANNAPFQLWLIGQRSGVETTRLMYTFNVSEEWNKIYLNITDFAAVLQQNSYALLFRALLPRNEQGAYAQPNADIRIDNVSIVHF
ncbi:MAG: hypothetical protein ACK4NS_07045 [Saprospiraceae bacterium]